MGGKGLECRSTTLLKHSGEKGGVGEKKDLGHSQGEKGGGNERETASEGTDATVPGDRRKKQGKRTTEAIRNRRSGKDK